MLKMLINISIYDLTLLTSLTSFNHFNDQPNPYQTSS